MEKYPCFVSDCRRPAKLFCECQASPILVCSRHLTRHSVTPHEHSFKPIFQELPHDQQQILKRLRECLEEATQNSINQVLRHTREGIDPATREKQAAALRLLTTIGQDNRQKARVKVLE